MSEEKNEKPTPKKIEDARKKGQVATSRDLARLAMLLVVGELAFVTEGWWRDSLESLITLAVSGTTQPFDFAMQQILGAATTVMLLVFGVLFIVCSVVAFASHWGQFGILVAPESITPKFDKLDPVNGAKQLFSKKKVGELLLTTAKATLIGVVIYVLVRNELPSILHLSGGAPKDVYLGFVTILRTIFHIVIGMCTLIAIADFALQKYSHLKSLNMDMEEIKREYRESEGDPLIKGTRKQLARELVESDPVERTEDANAVVVNPTHFAVAMLYEPGETPVPMVLAKGKDEVAQAMIRRARKCGIPVIRHVWLARTLYATSKPDTVVPKSSYEAVAHVYAVVNELLEQGMTEPSAELESYGDPP